MSLSSSHALHRSLSRQPPKIALHGLLHLRIVRATGLSAGAHSLVGVLGRVVTNASDTYAELRAGTRVLLKTRVCAGGGAHPVWDERGVVDVADVSTSLTLVVFASACVNLGRLVRPRTLGFCEVDVLTAGAGEVRFELRSKHRRGRAGVVVLEVGFEKVGRGGYEVPNAYFPMRRSCMLTMFQDAHVPQGCLPGVVDGAGVPFQQRCAWRDMYNALLGAERVIYITGWSVMTELVMVRDGEGAAGGRGGVLTLGELLVRKAEEGVQVSVLIWDEITSHDMLAGLLKTVGVMGVRDEETYNYFKGTKVSCEKVSRIDDGTNGLFGHIAIGGLWSHHMKSVSFFSAAKRSAAGVTSFLTRLCRVEFRFCVTDRDCPLDGAGRRRLVAYLGGLDLTYGR